MIKVAIAKSASERMECFKIRYAVFVRELGVYDESSFPDSMESDSFDKLDRTKNFIAYSDLQPAGTVRLITGTNETGFGLPFGRQWAIEGVDVLPNQLAEIPRSSVLPDYRHTSALGKLWATAFCYSVEHGIELLVADAYPESACPKLMQQIETYALKHDLYSDQIKCRPRRVKSIAPNVNTSRHIDSVRDLPSTIRMFFRLGGKLCGTGCYFSDFSGYSFPFVWDLRKVSDKRKSLLFRLASTR